MRKRKDIGIWLAIGVTAYYVYQQRKKKQRAALSAQPRIVNIIGA